jgi:hypothetical protein
MCEVLRAFLGVGSVVSSPRHKPHHDDEVCYTVQRTRDLAEVIVPFMDAHLPASYKRTQYEAWRAAVVDQWRARGANRSCTVDGCDEPRRAMGLCRAHYYVAYDR